MYKKVVPILLAILLTLALAGCADEQPSEDAGSGDQAGGGETVTEETVTVTEDTEPSEETTIEETTSEETTTGETTAGETTAGGGTTVSASGGGVAVGGFVVENANAPDTTIPEVSTSRQDAQEYLDQVQPIIENSVQDVSNLANPEVRVEDGNLTLDLPLDRLENTRNDIRDGLDQLRQIDPPQSLEPINQQLIQAFERVLPAYTDIIEAADSGDPSRISNAVQENLPRVERFNSETRAILQDLEQAAGN